jgi:exodeoxyribonuclease V gamma subunit
VLDAREAETERWQRRLWLSMFGAGGLAERSTNAGGRRLVPMNEAVLALDPRAAALPSAVHVFAFAHVARSFHELFERIARAVDVVVYSLSPCEGFWEDVDPLDPAPLHLWGRPGREQVRALNAAAGFEHEDRFVDPLEHAEPSSRTLLRRVQSDVLRRVPVRSPADAGPSMPDDESILVFEHASIRREMEAVVSEIWRLVEADETLRFDEIAVLVPEADEDAYAAHLPAVFRETHDLPYQAVGLSLAGATRIAEAINLLFALPLGRFTRQDVLRVALHPAIAGSVQGVSRTRWVAWCDALGVVHGADRADHEGTYIARDTLNWDQGLRRLALGSFMAGDASGDRTPFELRGEAYVPHEVPPSELHDAASFGRLMRSLLNDAGFVRTAELTMQEWGAFLRSAVEAYVVPSSDAEEEELARHLRRLHGVGSVDIGGRRVRYRIAYEVARARLAHVVRGQSGEGVIVSTLASVRPLPFRVVFACGMGEGLFPKQEPDDPLDLRWARRREGDVTARDRDRYAFLELLIGTNDRLVLSYVSRDAVTADALAPSSVVDELLHALGQGYGVNARALSRRHPLRRWDPSYFPELLPDGALHDRRLGTIRIPEARAEARTLALRRSMQSHATRVSGSPEMKVGEIGRKPSPTKASPALGPDEVLVRAIVDPSWAALAEHLGLVNLPRRPRALEARLTIPLYAIMKFLEFPLQGWAAFRLGLDELGDDDTMAREDEPFETSFRDETMFLRGVLLDATRTNRTLAEAYDDAVRQRELRGAGPSGVFARGERGDHLETLDTWCAELAARNVPFSSIEVHRFGRAGEHAQADRVHDAVGIDVDFVDASGVARIVRADIGGRTLPMGADASVSLTLAKRVEQDDDWASAGRERGALRAFLDHAILTASGAFPARAHGSLSVIATPDGPQVDHVWFAPLSHGEAIGWIRDVVRDLLCGPHAYFMPCEAVFIRDRRDPKGPALPWLEQARQKIADSDGAPALRSAYGPVPRLSEYPLPDEDRACAIIARRFGRLFEKREGPR